MEPKEDPEDLEEPTDGDKKPAQKTSSDRTAVPVTDTAEYKGLQRKYNKLWEKFEKLQSDYDQLEDQLAETKLSTDTHTREHETLKSSLTAKDTEIAQLKAQIKDLEGSQQRQKLIMAEYPELAEFEAEGLLPKAESEEDLRAKFSKFKEALGKRVDDKTKKKFEGTGAKPTEGKTDKTGDADPDRLWAEIIRLAGSSDPKDRAEYEDKYQLYLKLTQQEA